MNHKGILLALTTAWCSVAETPAASTYISADVKPPPLPLREFRGAWVATVANIDWPSKPGLPVKEQKAELVAILDRAAKLNLNAIVLQVRPACDAMYESKIEPWSYYLTGVSGRAPFPFYDPLAFAVEEAHKRGLELHAWFNPYRAGHPSARGAMSPNHISRKRPDLAHAYGDKIWLDPGDKEVQNYSLSVVMDVVKRYDIDGVHFDDYFYPYRETNAAGHEIEFPDGASWKHYAAGGGKLARDDWRRDNVNSFVHRVYEAIKAEKPWVKFGIAPFGIWQPGSPPQITGFNAYSVLYCDSRKWLAEGWLDYCAPQLYWSIASAGQSFLVLLKWWEEQNPMHRHIWPGLNAGKVSEAPADGRRRRDKAWDASEIVNQVRLTREQGAGTGCIQWSMACLMEDRGGIATALRREVYNAPALVPASPWLENQPPARPKARLEGGKLKLEPGGLDKIALWVVQTQIGPGWSTSILRGDSRSLRVDGAPELVAVTAIDRCGVASPASVLQKVREGGKVK